MSIVSVIMKPSNLLNLILFWSIVGPNPLIYIGFLVVLNIIELIKIQNQPMEVCHE